MRKWLMFSFIFAASAFADPPKILPPIEKKDLEEALKKALPGRIPREVTLEIRNAQLTLQILIQHAARIYQFDPDAGDDVDLQTGIITRKKPVAPARPPANK
jgi:hypothetical protein